MEIVYNEPEKNLYPFPERWFQNQPRYERMTSVRLLGNNRLIAANRQAMKMYYMEYDLTKKTVRMLDQIVLRHNTTAHFPTLVRVQGDIVYYTGLDSYVGRVRIQGNKLARMSPIQVPVKAQFHGVTFHPRDPDFMFLAGAVHDPKMVTYHRRTGETREYQLKGLEGIRIKQVDFLGGDYIVVSAATGNIATERGHTYDGYVSVYRVGNYDLVDTVFLPNGHLDDVCVNGNAVYVAYQGDEPFGKVLKYVFENEKLRHVSERPVSAFPHGVDVRDGLVAAACLKTSSVCILYENEFDESRS